MVDYQRHLPISYASAFSDGEQGLLVTVRETERAPKPRLFDRDRLIARLLYGAGLRGPECCRLRVQDLDFAANQILVRGGKDRITMLPAVAKSDLGPGINDIAG